MRCTRARPDRDYRPENPAVPYHAHALGLGPTSGSRAG